MNILRWRQLWSKRASKRLGYTLQGGRIGSRNILQHDRFWTSVKDMLGGRERGCLSGGFNRRKWIQTEIRGERQWSQTEMRRNAGKERLRK